MNKRLTASGVSVIAGLSCSLMMASSSYAAECASVSFSPSKVNGKDVVLELVASNGQEVPRAKRYRKIVSGEQKYVLGAGEHTFLLRQWPKTEYITHYRNLKKGKDNAKLLKPVIKAIHTNLSGKMHYKFASTDNEHIKAIEQQMDQSVECDESSINARSTVTSSLLNSLPKDIQLKVTSTFSKIYNESKTLSNLFPIKVSNYFGVVFDSESSLSIKTIIPYSLAANLDLRKGDEIIALGDKSLSQPVTGSFNLLHNYIATVATGQVMSLKVKRDGQEVLLQGKNIPVVVPEVIYKQENKTNDVVNQTKLSNQLQFEFDILALALVDYFSKQQKFNDVNLLVPNVIKADNNPLVVSIGLSHIGKAKDNLLSLTEQHNNQDFSNYKHQKTWDYRTKPLGGGINY